MTQRAQINRNQAIEIARRFAKKHQPSYYAEPFHPHEWVIDAILEAANEPYEARDADGNTTQG